MPECHASQDCCSVPHPAGGCCRHMHLPETPEHTQASLAQSFVGSLLLSPGSCYAQGFACALQESLSPQSCEGSVIKSMGCQSQRVLSPFAGSPGWEICCGGLELSQQCKNFFGITVFQVVGRLLGGAIVELTVTSSRRTPWWLRR